MKNPVVIAIVVAVIIGVLAFFGGMKYQQTVRGNFRAGQFGGNGNYMMQGGQRGGGPNGGRGAGFRPAIGEIISSDDKSITVKMDDGSSKIVLVSDSTTINKTDPGSKTDLKVGTKVGVFGQDNNGTVTAQNIQINPMIRNNPNNSPSTSAR